MSKRVVLLRYGELFLKSEPVMRQFISALIVSLNRSLKAHDLDAVITTPRGRIFIEGSLPEKIAELASRIFGVIDVSIALKTENDPDSLANAAAEIAALKLKEGMSFAVRPTRQGVPGFSSQELGARVGSEILNRFPGISVNLSSPDYEIFVESRPFGGYAYDKRIPGPGGLPSCTQGTVVSLISSGLDSPVASWLMMKRGCDIIHLHIDGGKWAGPDVLSTAIESHAALSLWAAGVKMELIVVPAESFYSDLVSLTNPRYRCIICKRFMYRLGSRITDITGAYALVTGENLGQVASQTLSNLAVISESANVAVIRPLITNDKTDTIVIARNIGTFVKGNKDLGCRAVPARPATKSTIDEIVKAESKIGIEGHIERAVAEKRSIFALNGEII